MKTLESKYWLSCLSSLDFAFQPIVNIHTGVCYGCEALLRNCRAAGFKSVPAFFDQAYRDKVLHQVDLGLREKAVRKFASLGWPHLPKMFFNLDTRVLDSEDYRPGITIGILERHGLPLDSVCFEITERQQFHDVREAVDILGAYRSQGFKIAVDDYGIGFSGLQMLYYTRPDFIKIDRFFIEDIGNDSNKRLFVSSVVNLAHLMGSIVIAEGVETKGEYYGCRSIGCDLIQGYFVAHPERDLNRLKAVYDHIGRLSGKDRRDKHSQDKKLIATEMRHIEPVFQDSELPEVFRKFREKREENLFPVLNRAMEPLGIVSEKSFKDYAYTRYGAQLLENPAFGKKLGRFVSRFPIADINTPVEKILEIYSQNESMEGILITENMRYKGFLSAHSLLKVLNEKNIAIARDQNPLTRLPGNTLIHEYVSQALQDTQERYVLVYFDFDNFKAYNDTYGFRHGDRVILLFADLLRSNTQNANRFAGHVGGDDFFMGVGGSSPEKVCSDVARMAGQFRHDAESFYDTEAIRRGYIEAADRDGRVRAFPLLTVSAVVLALPAFRSRVCSTDEVGNLLAKKKKQAKNSPEKICVAVMDGHEENSRKTAADTDIFSFSPSPTLAETQRRREGGEDTRQARKLMIRCL